MDNDYSLRFPIGESPIIEKYDGAEIQMHIDDIENLPIDLFHIVNSVENEKLKNHYRENGWTALQVIHHIADSHINSYCRFKLALTEINPAIKPYEEQEWANLYDYDEKMLDVTLNLIDALHKKWTYLMRNLSEEQWKRTFFHPGSKKQISLFQNVAIYAWHGKHHLKHIEIALR